MYDWALTLGQEVELIWSQHWSMMTILYLGVRYLGILFIALNLLYNVPTIPLKDTECFIVYVVWDWIGIMVFAMLWVIVIARLHAMYQRSRKILIFLIVIALAVNTFTCVAAIMAMTHVLGEEYILSGTYQCSLRFPDDIQLLDSIAWILSCVGEVIALCLVVWIGVKHFRESRLHSTGGITEDSFTVLIKTHVFYFASFIGVSCLQLIVHLSPLSMDTLSPATQICDALLQIFQVAQMFVLGPRLILNIREHYAKVTADSDAGTDMTSITFHARVYVSTSSGV